MIQARKTAILKVVNFQRLICSIAGYMRHHHTKDLLCMCVRARNQAALSILGKALLIHDQWFWGMIWEDNQRAYYGCIASSEALHHHNLVRTFIIHATSKDIVAMRQHLVNYVITYAGYNVVCEYGLISAICNMCNVEVGKLRVTRTGSNQVTFGSILSLLAWLEPPPNETLYRDTMIMLFDKLFPSARD
ncbi:hypothetical protein L1887_22331 [Cichorium endivia]|nr:hypothetical protein L1887_22331 [Cichorium endivia]